MEVASSSRTTKPEVDIKDDPEFKPNINQQNSLPMVKVKKEEDAEYGRIDQNLPEAATKEEDDIFEDVDGDSDEEVEYVDLDYEGLAEINGVQHFVCEGFKIRQIPEPFIVRRSLIDLFRCIEAGSIILDPEYQREVVWDEGRAACLVTSILMGYFIPPIIFNVKKSILKVEGREKQRFTRTCVDGKQRLTSVWKFMKGQIGFYDANSPQRKWYYCHQVVNGNVLPSSRLILPNAVKNFFEQQCFCCYEYNELPLDTEETMFQLVQRGVALTPAEKMRAMSTEWANFTKEYEDNYSLIVNLSKQNRASGFRLILTIFTMIQEVIAGKRKRSGFLSTPTLQASPPALFRVLENKTPISPQLKAKFKAVFDKYEALVKLSSVRITTTRWRIVYNSVFDPCPDFLLRDMNIHHVRTFSPLELVVTALLIAVHMDTRTNVQLLDDIKEMRRFLRTYHKDLRVNTQCWATAWNYITDEMKRRGAPRTGFLADPVVVTLHDDSSGHDPSVNGPRTPRPSTGVTFDDGSSPLSSAPSTPVSVMPYIGPNSSDSNSGPSNEFSATTASRDSSQESSDATQESNATISNENANSDDEGPIYIRKPKRLMSAERQVSPPSKKMKSELSA